MARRRRDSHRSDDQENNQSDGRFADCIPLQSRRGFATVRGCEQRLELQEIDRRQAKKRGGEFQITSIGADSAADAVRPEQLEQLDGALHTLAAADPALAQLVDLHFFCGFSLTELAGLQGVSERTIQRNWRKARLLLHRAMQDV